MNYAQTTGLYAGLEASPEYLQAFRWPFHVARTLVACLGRQYLQTSALVMARAASTWFSGAATFEQAWRMSRAAFQLEGIECNMAELFACDSSPICQEFLLQHTCGHVYGEVESFLTLPAGFDASWPYMLKYYWIQQAQLRPSCHCRRHRRVDRFFLAQCLERSVLRKAQCLMSLNCCGLDRFRGLRPMPLTPSASGVCMGAGCKAASCKAAGLQAAGLRAAGVKAARVALQAARLQCKLQGLRCRLQGGPGQFAQGRKRCTVAF
jgi:hypothetical protein